MPHTASRLNPRRAPGRSARFATSVALVLVVTNLATILPARADLAIETETARLTQAGGFAAGAAFEFQTDPTGKEYALPMAFEYGISNRLEVLIEPVPYVSIRPSDDVSATGFGDVEAALTYLVRQETHSGPAFAVAGEIKFPTAHNTAIDSGELDYRLYLVASKRVGKVDLHANLGYNIIGAPAGVRTRNPIDMEIAAEWFVNPKFDVFGEVTNIGTALRTAGSEGTADVGGKETVGSVGVRAHLTPRFTLFGSFSYNNSHAKLFRTGVNLNF